MSENLPFGFDKPKASPGFLLWQTTVVWQRQIKKVLEPYGISHAQFVIMATLLWFSAHGHKTTQTLIVEWSKLDPMTVSKSLKKLSQEGYTARKEAPSDSRAKEVTLTEQGRDLVHTLVPLVEAVDQHFFARLSGNLKEPLIQILTQLAD